MVQEVRRVSTLVLFVVACGGEPAKAPPPVAHTVASATTAPVEVTTPARIEVVGDAISLDGKVIARVEQQTELKRIEPLFDALRERSGPRTEPFVSFDPRTRAVVANSVLQTVAYAGFTNPVLVDERVATPVAHDGDVSGHIPAEIIQRVVRARFPELRKCYEDGLGRDPKLAGRIAVKFAIGAKGNVTSAAAHDATTLPDKAVVQCVVSVFMTMTFEAPGKNGITVVYPIEFTP